MSKLTHFQEELLRNSKYNLWIASVKDTKNVTCSLCKSYISLSGLGCSGLHDHACDKKRKQKVKVTRRSLSSYFKFNTCILQRNKKIL